MKEDVKEFVEWLKSEEANEWRKMVPKYVSKEVQITLLSVAWMFGRIYGYDVKYLFELVPELLKQPKLIIDE